MNTGFMSRRSPLAWLGLLALSLAAAGCGPASDIYPTRGEAFAAGQPAVGAVVTFYPVNAEAGKPKRIPTAVVEKDGSFHLTTLSANDGAPPGEYVVTITWCDSYRDDGDTVTGPDRLQGRYANPQYPALRATIQPGKNELKRFDLN